MSSHDEKMNQLYDAFLQDLLTVVRSGKIKASDRAVIRQFLRDHDMAAKKPKPTTLESLIGQIPEFDDEENGDDH